MAKVFGLATLIVTGAIIANIWTRPEGTRAATEGVARLWKPSLNAVLGHPS